MPRLKWDRDWRLRKDIALVRERTKRIRRLPEEARTQILDMTEKLMLEEGYAAVSTRRIAKELAITGAAVHHYFATTDDLFAALHSRMTEQQLERFIQIAACDDPLRALWYVQSSGTASALGVEFLAAANHRKAIREQIIASSENARRVQAQMLEVYLEGSALGANGAAALIVAVSRMLSNEGMLGIDLGHEEVREIIDRTFDWLATNRKSATPRQNALNTDGSKRAPGTVPRIRSV